MGLGMQELAVVFADILPKFSFFIFRSSQEWPPLQGSPDHKDTTHSSSVDESGYLKKTGDVAYILSALTSLKNTCKTNCCFETLCTLAKEVRHCANCKVLPGVYGVLQNATTIQMLVHDVYIAPSTLKFVTAKSIVLSRRILHNEICDYNNQLVSLYLISMVIL